MYGIDIVSGYVVCGAGALAGAALLALMRAESARTAFASRLFAAALACMGAGLAAFALAYDLPMGWISHGSATACAVGMTLAGWALRELNGYRTSPRLGWGLTGGTLLVMVGGWALLSPLGFGIAFCVLGLVIAVATCAGQFHFMQAALLSLRRPAETALALGMLGFALVWVLRTGYTLGYQGQALIHHLYVPEERAGAFMLAYAAMPVLAATLWITVVNSRLTQLLERRALTDEMTGLVSRRGLREMGPVVLQRAADKLQDVAVLMLDIDHFRRVNEEHGQLAGDDVLCDMARLLKQVMRADAMLVRYGGEEFALLVPLDHAAMAGHVAERVRLAVEKRSWAAGGATVAVTASLGLTLHRTGEPLDKALMRADRLLYQAKASGRNCICDDLDGPSELDLPVDPSAAMEPTVANADAPASAPAQTA